MYEIAPPRTGALLPAEIDILLRHGGKRWQKKGDRIYLDAADLGLEYTTYKTGNISSAAVCGEEISNTKANEMLKASTWIDVETGDLYCDSRFSRQFAEKLLARLRSMPLPTPEETPDPEETVQDAATQDESDPDDTGEKTGRYMSGAEFKAIRKSLGLTQTELGEIMGLNQQSVCAIERDDRPPHPTRQQAAFIRYIAAHQQPGSPPPSEKKPKKRKKNPLKMTIEELLEAYNNEE